MLPLAVTALEAMKDLPKELAEDRHRGRGDYHRGGGGAKIVKMNKIIIGVIVFVASTIVFFSWVYHGMNPNS